MVTHVRGSSGAVICHVKNNGGISVPSSLKGEDRREGLEYMISVFTQNITDSDDSFNINDSTEDLDDAIFQVRFGALCLYERYLELDYGVSRGNESIEQHEATFNKIRKNFRYNNRVYVFRWLLSLFNGNKNYTLIPKESLLQHIAAVQLMVREKLDSPLEQSFVTGGEDEDSDTLDESQSADVAVDSSESTEHSESNESSGKAETSGKSKKESTAAVDSSWLND